jgi:protein-L-isoaspartate(D-aspartate) O-methyltransferase
MEDFEQARLAMVERQIRRRGIKDKYVLHAMETVERHLFVPKSQQSYAYDDHPLPIGYGQTISQPYIVALMTELLAVEPANNVLEIGAGSGYQAALLGTIAEKVTTIERIPELAEFARENLDRAGLVNVDVFEGDGTLGWPKNAPFDRIMVTAAGPDLPEALGDQLAEGGRLVIPMGGQHLQDLYLYIKTGGKLERFNHGGCRFVKLIGEQGWTDE